LKGLYITCREHALRVFVPRWPSCDAPRLTKPHSSEARCAPALPRTPPGSPVGAVLPKRSASAGCSLHSLPISWVPPADAGPFSSCRSQGPFYNEESGHAFSYAFENGSAHDTKRRAPRKWEGPAPQGVGAECRSSRWLQIAKQNRTHRRAERRAGLCSTHPASEDARLAQRGGDLEGQRGTKTRSACSRHVI
jgi:hypothetical protein